MRATQFKRLLDLVDTLTGKQLQELAKAVATAATERTSLSVIEAALPTACRHCGSTNVVRNGTRDGLQRGHRDTPFKAAAQRTLRDLCTLHARGDDGAQGCG